jgi:O-antigen/teichoic acid export membrane protein
MSARPVPGEMAAAGATASVRQGAADTAAYVAGSLAYKLVAFLAVPVLARLLSPAELGLLDLTVVTAGMIAIIAGGGLDHAVARFEQQQHSAGRLWITALAAFATIGVLVGVLAILAAPAVMSWAAGAMDDPSLLSLATGYGISMAMMATAMNVVRLRAGAKRYAVIAFCLLTLEMATAIALAVAGFTVQAILAGWIALSAFGSLAVAAVHLPRLSSLDPALYRRLIAFGLPLVPAAVAWHVGEVGIRASIAGTGDLAGLGAYGVAHRITSVLAIAVSGFALAWQPLVYRADGSQQRIIASRGVAMTVGAVAIGALVVSGVARELIVLIGGAGYLRGADVVALLGLAAVFSGAFSLLTVLAGVENRTLIVAASAGVGVLVQIVGAVALVPAGGLLGAAAASVAGYAVSAVLLFGLYGNRADSRAATWRIVGTGMIACASLVALTALGADAALIIRLGISLVAVLMIAAMTVGDGRALIGLLRRPAVREPR